MSHSSSTPNTPPPSSLKLKSKPNGSDVKKVRRSLHSKSADQTQPPFNRTLPVVERPRRPQRVSDAAEKKELQEKLELSESVIKNLESEVLALKDELEKANISNKELMSRNDKLSKDLAAALTSPPQDSKPIFKDINKLVALKLESSALNIATPPPSGGEAKGPPPPPPPPLRPLPKGRAAASAPKPPAVVELFHALTKDKRDSPAAPANHFKSAAITAHTSIVGEIQNRSAHLLAIKADIETKGDFIRGLIQKVVTAAYTDIEDVLNFADWLDAQLSSLVDERAVLRHFNWPERKADAIREAAIEYRGLKQLESEISFFKDDTSIPCGIALKKIAALLDKSERGIQRLIKLRNSVMRSYQEWKIPTDWMLDFGIVKKIKQASMRLAKMYMRRVMIELELGRTSERESNQEALLLQGVNFAYRTHQFAGGLDSETLCALEEIVPRHLGRCQELLLAAIPSS